MWFIDVDVGCEACYSEERSNEDLPIEAALRFRTGRMEPRLYERQGFFHVRPPTDTKRTPLHCGLTAQPPIAPDPI